MSNTVIGILIGAGMYKILIGGGEDGDGDRIEGGVYLIPRGTVVVVVAAIERSSVLRMLVVGMLKWRWGVQKIGNFVNEN